MDVTIELKPELTAVVTALAAELGQSPEWVIAQAIETFLAAAEDHGQVNADGIDH